MYTMENFLSWDVLLTFTGCVAGTVLLTEWLKKVFDEVPTQLVSFVIAFCILIVGKLATNTFTWGELPLNLINAIAVSLSANGGFDVLKRAFGKTEFVTEELVLDEGDPENGEGTYLNLSKDIADFKDGEVVTFKVKKISQK